jgi:hypothetical protein
MKNQNSSKKTMSRSELLLLNGQRVGVEGLCSNIVFHDSVVQVCLVSPVINGYSATFDHINIMISTVAYRRLRQKTSQRGGFFVRFTGTPRVYLRKNGTLDVSLFSINHLMIDQNGWRHVSTSVNHNLEWMDAKVDLAVYQLELRNHQYYVDELCRRFPKLKNRALLQAVARVGRGEVLKSGQLNLVQIALAQNNQYPEPPIQGIRTTTPIFSVQP